jgi:hypothetical protein
MARFIWLSLAALLALALPAQAQDVVFPTGSRVGLAPPPGVTISRSLVGFEDPPNNVAIIMLALPPEAYSELEKSTADAPMQQKGLTVESREQLSLASGKAFLVIARQVAEGTKLRKWIMATATPELTALVTFQIPDNAREAYPDAALRTAIASVAVRHTVPVEEQLSLLPFKVAELAGFRVAGVMAGRALILTDAPAEGPSPSGAAQLIIGIAPGGPTQNADRDTFANDVFTTIPNLKEVRRTSSEPLRVGGQPGHQIMARGKDVTTGAEVTIVQWLRFGSGAYMHFVGVAPSERWTAAYARFRQVRDGIDTP